MVRFIYKVRVLSFIFLGVFLYSQEKKPFYDVASVLQNIIPEIKTDSWSLIHQNSGKDTVIKSSSADKNYTSQSSGFNVGIVEENEFYYIVYFLGGKTEYINDLEGLKKFVGKVNNIHDAAVFAATQGYIIDENFRDVAGNYYEDPSNYYLDLGKLTSKECPYQKKYFTLTVSKSTGNISGVKDNGPYIELYNKKCTNNPRLLKIEKKEEPKDEPKKPARSPKRR
ncbi:hypothetical protein [Chryseobacterium gregarium]|uniref:hypothetical protein n=1 Tax=Chryseobacterium gregarium TaxID=456299 RepID=UPI0003FA1A11|nr:hypothetical protein [Chryseobacterium gregarium]